MTKNVPLVLLILDGWGYNENYKNNAIANARKPQWDKWWQHYPHTLLQTSGTQVGLPPGQMGNSEVGHMHIGAGRIIQQDYTRINAAIQNGEFSNNSCLAHAIEQLQIKKRSLHIMGLLSKGGVHSHENHLFAILDYCWHKQFKSVYLHLFLDGRDTPPQSAYQSLELLHQELRRHPVATICSISGRYYAMDRDNRWERVLPVYELITQGLSQLQFDTPEAALNYYYQQNITDEFIPPTRIGEPNTIKDDDSVLYFNFRADRARALSEAFVNPTFDGFKQKCPLKLSQFITMTQYDERLKTSILFPSIHLKNTFGEIISKLGLKQLRIAETEKYAHVTFFFNGGCENHFVNEQRILIPSPKIATYDLKPQMSAPELTNTLVDTINKGSFDVIICNYANADMVGHTGNFKATVAAIECLDQCMQKVSEALTIQRGLLLITADHGNAEMMFDEHSNQTHTAHTNFPVPFLCISSQYRFIKNEGSLIDIAPTMLTLLGFSIPSEMEGINLLERLEVQNET